MAKTLVIGASENPSRYSNMAMEQLKKYGHYVVALGLRNGKAHGIEIQQGKPHYAEIETITLYINPTNQKAWYDYILQTQPKRIIFNPGTENAELEKLATEKGIETIEGCTLVMLRTNQY